MAVSVLPRSLWPEARNGHLPLLLLLCPGEGRPPHKAGEQHGQLGRGGRESDYTNVGRRSGGLDGSVERGFLPSVAGLRRIFDLGLAQILE